MGFLWSVSKEKINLYADDTVLFRRLGLYALQQADSSAGLLKSLILEQYV